MKGNKKRKERRWTYWIMLKNFPELNFVCLRNIGLHSKGARVLKQWLPKKKKKILLNFWTSVYIQK